MKCHEIRDIQSSSTVTFSTMSTLAYSGKRSSFNCEQLKTFIYSKEFLYLQDHVLVELRKWSSSYSQNLDYQQIEEHERQSIQNFLRTNLIIQNSSKDYTETLLHYISLFDPSAVVLTAVSSILFSETIKTLGTENHLKYYEDATTGKLIGAFCLTEVGHGSNVKSLQTTATYDNRNGEFVLHTPTFEAAKAWNIGLGKLATHAIVFAHLITPDGKNHGLHGFIVAIRSLQTLLPYPGVTVTSLGEKLGLNGGGHGVLSFDNYRAPREVLLNKFTEVTMEGKYNTKDEHQQLLTSVAVLIAARINLICMAWGHSLVISLATQNASTEKNLAQCNQFRLIPYIAFIYVNILFIKCLRKMEQKFAQNINKDLEDINLLFFGMEMHMMTSSSKSFIMATNRDCTRDCFESCGKLAYLRSGVLSSVKYLAETGCTIEGDNHVLIQQTSNILMKLWQMVLDKQEIDFPLSSVNFLNRAFEILGYKFNVLPMELFTKIENLLNYYKWLICYLVRKSYENRQRHLNVMKEQRFWAVSETQIYYCKELSLAYIEHFVIQEVNNLISHAPEVSVKLVLNKLLSLFALCGLQKYVMFFYQGGYANDSQFGKLLEDSILSLCNDLKEDALNLSSVISDHNYLYVSIFDQTRDDLYKKMETQVHGANTYSVPKWINQIAKNKNRISSKL